MAGAFAEGRVRSRRRVLITTQIFPPERHPTGIMVRQLAEDLSEAGLDVVVAAGLPHHPAGEVPREFRQRLWWEEPARGYLVARTWHPVLRSRRVPVRAAVMLGQTAAINLRGLLVGGIDAVVSFGGPPLVGPLASSLIALAHSSPVVTVIHDIYPDVLLAERNVPWVVERALRRFEKLQYQLADRIVVLGEATRMLLIERGVSPSKVATVPVWLDEAEITPQSRSNAWRRAVGIPEDCIVALYAGTAGRISGAECLADVALGLPEDFKVVVVGGGSAWESLRNSKAASLGRLVALPFQPREQLAEVQAVSDVALVTLLKGRGLTSVPSKVQGYLAAGRPVIAAVDGESDTARLIRSEEIGVVVPPESPVDLVEAIIQLGRDGAARRRMGERARSVFERNFSRRSATEAIRGIVEQVMGGRR